MNFSQITDITIPEGTVTQITANSAVLWKKVTTPQWSCPFTGTITGSTNSTNTYTTIDSTAASGLYIIQNQSGGTSIQYHNGIWSTPQMISEWPPTNAPFLIYSPNLGYAYWPYYDSQHGFSIMYTTVDAVRYRRQSTSIATRVTFIPGMQIYLNQSYPPAVAGTPTFDSIVHNLQQSLQNNKMICIINTSGVSTSNTGSDIQILNASCPIYICYANNYQENINHFMLNTIQFDGSNYRTNTFNEVADPNYLINTIGTTATFTPYTTNGTSSLALLELIPV